MLRVGIIGYGAIGRELCAALEDGRAGEAVLSGILVRRAGGDARQSVDVEAFLGTSPDVVVECAGQPAVRQHGSAILERGVDLVITSVGALADQALFDTLLEAAEAAQARLIVPSAGVGALDMLAGAAVGGLDGVTITVRKDPSAWRGTPAEQICDLDRLTAPATLYEGPVRQGAQLYPANVNISAATALAGLGLDDTVLKVVADPGIETHVIEIDARGVFGRFHFVEDVLPDESNRKTGKIVAMALIKTLRQMSSTLVIGA